MRILSHHILHQAWSTLSRYVIEYVRRDGRREEHVREILDSGDGAAILLYNRDRRTIVLVRQFRLVTQLGGELDPFILECCAGLLDNLDPTAAIIKEVREETGYHITEVQSLYSAYASPGIHMEKIHFFTASYDPSHRLDMGGGSLDEQEEIEVIEYPWSAIPELLSSGHIIDSKTIILLQWAQLHLL
jgi:GDP-mannose pyrophosphatase NudK